MSVSLAGRGIALGDPEAEDARLRAARGDLQIETAAVAVDARAFFPATFSALSLPSMSVPSGTPAWGAKWKEALRDNYLSSAKKKIFLLRLRPF